MDEVNSAADVNCKTCRVNDKPNMECPVKDEISSAVGTTLCDTGLLSYREEFLNFRILARQPFIGFLGTARPLPSVVIL